MKILWSSRSIESIHPVFIIYCLFVGMGMILLYVITLTSKLKEGRKTFSGVLITIIGIFSIAIPIPFFVREGDIASDMFGSWNVTSGEIISRPTLNDLLVTVIPVIVVLTIMFIVIGVTKWKQKEGI